MWSQGHEGIVALPAPSSFGLFQFLPWTPADTPLLQAGDGAEVMQASSLQPPLLWVGKHCTPVGGQALQAHGRKPSDKSNFTSLTLQRLAGNPTSSVHPKPFWVPDRSNRTVACCQARD